MGIIRGNIKDKHTISGFSFRDLDSEKIEYIDEDSFQPMPIKTVSEPQSYGAVTQNRSVENVEDINRRDGMISSLLEKSDSLSKELVKVQKQLSDQENLFRDDMRNLEENSYQRGLQDGLLKAKTDMENLYSSDLNQLGASINKLEDLSSKVSSMMKSVEKELVHTSIAIAKEVIDSEISFNSGQVAINLAKSLIQKLDDAKEITIRVNSNDYESLKIGLSDLENIKIVQDGAVVKGGVIIISSVGSIEGNIMERYKKVSSDSLSKIDG